MKRFLMLVGVAAVAAAVYVAASPASQQSKAPTAKQFNALKKEVASLNKTLKTVKAEANSAAGFIATCLTSQNSGVVPVSQFGTTTDGFLFGSPSASPPYTARTALDVDPGASPQGFLQAVDPSCLSSTTAARSGAVHTGPSLLRRAERAH
jgi:hypothetical protein